jgi:hypothetical protein
MTTVRQMAEIGDWHAALAVMLVELRTGQRGIVVRRRVRPEDGVAEYTVCQIRQPYRFLHLAECYLCFSDWRAPHHWRQP